MPAVLWEMWPVVLTSRTLRCHICAAGVLAQGVVDQGAPDNPAPTVDAPDNSATAADRTADILIDDWLNEPLCSVPLPPPSPTDNNQPPQVYLSSS